MLVNDTIAGTYEYVLDISMELMGVFTEQRASLDEHVSRL